MTIGTDPQLFELTDMGASLAHMRAAELSIPAPGAAFVYRDAAAGKYWATTSRHAGRGRELLGEYRLGEVFFLPD